MQKTLSEYKREKNRWDNLNDIEKALNQEPKWDQLEGYKKITNPINKPYKK